MFDSPGWRSSERGSKAPARASAGGAGATGTGVERRTGGGTEASDDGFGAALSVPTDVASSALALADTDKKANITDT